MVDLGLKTGTIATRNEDEQIDTGAGTIEVVPTWRYFLDLAEPVVWPHEISAATVCLTHK